MTTRFSLGSVHYLLTGFDFATFRWWLFIGFQWNRFSWWIAIASIGFFYYNCSLSALIFRDISTVVENEGTNCVDSVDFKIDLTQNYATLETLSFSWNFSDPVLLLKLADFNTKLVPFFSSRFSLIGWFFYFRIKKKEAATRDCYNVGGIWKFRKKTTKRKRNFFSPPPSLIVDVKRLSPTRSVTESVETLFFFQPED